MEHEPTPRLDRTADKHRHLGDRGIQRSGRALLPMTPIFLSYILSFVNVAIYWNNHHHLMQAAQKVNGPILWANMILLFALSLFPFATAWMGENHFSSTPVAFYGMALIFAATAYTLLVKALIVYHGENSVLATAIGSDTKGKVSLLLYAVSIPLAFFLPSFSCLLYAAVAIMWLVPDKRIEKVLH